MGPDWNRASHSQETLNGQRSLERATRIDMVAMNDGEASIRSHITKFEYSNSCLQSTNVAQSTQSFTSYLNLFSSCSTEPPVLEVCMRPCSRSSIRFPFLCWSVRFRRGPGPSEGNPT